jgi:hypothetical protein
MEKLLATAAIIGTLMGSAQADDYDYLCLDHHKLYPVVLDCNEDNSICTIKWRGKTYADVKLAEGCKAEWSGPGVDLCAQTKGFARLTIGKTTFHCRMPLSERAR